METQYINLNMTPTGVTPTFHISQYDVGRMLGFIVHSGGATVDLDTYTCTIEATRSDGTAITSAVATTDNIGTFEVTPTMSNKADKYKCQLVIVDANSKRIASLPFDMDVCKAAMDENAESIEEDVSLYQQYTEAVQGAIAEANADIQTEENARIAAVNAEATARQTADNTLQGNINSEASTRAAADAVLQGQIDNFVQLPSGSTAADAELVNIRVKADGTSAATAGNAVREQFTELKSAFDFAAYTGEKIITNFNQGLPLLPSKSDRCTTGYCYCHVGDVISCTGVPAGMKYAVGGEGYDSGWKTADFQYTVMAEGNYTCNIAKSNGTDAITPDEITGLSVTFTDKSSNVYKNKNAINMLSSGHKNFIGRNVGEKYPINMKKGEKYTVSTADGQNFPVSFRIQYFDENGTGIDSDTIPAGVNQYTITLAHENVKFVNLHESPQTVIQLEIGDTKTSFEPYYKDVLECNNILWAKDISRKGYFVIDKNEMVNGTRDETGYVDFRNRCHSRDIFIPAHKGDRVIASTPDNDGSVIVAVTEAPLGTDVIYTSGWQQAIDMVNENEGYYIFLGKTTAELFNGTFKVIPNIYANGQNDGVFSQEITDTINSVREYQTEPSITFILCTDIHYGVSENGNRYLFDISAENMKAVLNSIRADFAVCLGDVTEGDSSNTGTYAAKVNNAIRNLGVPYLLAIGNHDDNRYETDSTFTAEDMYRYYDSFAYNRVVFNDNTNGRDYYVDCENYKTRFVVLDSNTVGAYGFASATVTWFQNIALNTPSDYLVVVLVHESSIPAQNYNNSSLANGTAITDAITDYLESGKPIIQFYGHSHCDVAFTSPFLSIGTNCLKFENTNGDPSKWPSGATKPTRAVGEISEDCWDMVVLRPLSRKVDCIRFGAGNNRSFTY